MNIRPFFDPATSTFSYLVDDGRGACAVIDPVMGFDARSGRRDDTPVRVIAEVIEREGLELHWLLETHAHADHLSGGPWLKQRLGGVLAIGEHIRQVQQVFGEVFHVADLRPGGADFDRLLADGERLRIGSLEVEVLHLPGHTPADVAFRVSAPGFSDAVFVGDTLFMPDAGSARCDFPGGDARALYRSARRLLALAARTRLYVCHDYPAPGQPARAMATVAQHRAANIHVRDGVEEEAFAALRQARDATLAMPLLMLPAVQVNIRAGRLPAAEGNGTAYLKIPVDRM